MQAEELGFVFQDKLPKEELYDEGTDLTRLIIKKIQLAEDQIEFILKDALKSFKGKMKMLYEDVEHIDNKQREVLAEVHGITGTEPVRLRVGPRDFTVGRNVLTSVPGSLMSATFAKGVKHNTVEGGMVFLDRDPDLFNHILFFLRSNRTFLPREISSDMKEALENEIKYWKLEKGLIKLYSYTNADAQKVNDLLKSLPQINQEKSLKSLEAWQKLKPLTIEEIMRYSELRPCVDDDMTQFKKVNFKNYFAIGQFRKGTNIINGMARRIFDSNLVQEGMFANGDLSGYVRIVYQNGASYTGSFRNFMRNGYGVNVQSNGEKQVGLWRENDYLGPGVQPQYN